MVVVNELLSRSFYNLARIRGFRRDLMRVLLATIGHFHERPGGSPKVALDEALELVCRGHEVWMLAPGGDSEPEHELKEGINYLRYVPAPVEHWNPARASRHQDAATAVLQRHLPHADAIHGHVPLPALAAMDFYGDSVPSSYTIHSPAKMEMAIEWKSSSIVGRIVASAGLVMINRMEAECLRRSKAVTALSQYTIDCIGALHGRAIAEKVQLIPGWVDTTRFVPAADRDRAKSELGWPRDLPVLFTLRRLVSRMGLDRLLDACHLLLKQGLRFHLVIGGEGPMREKLEQQSRSLGLGGTVTFLGRVPDQVVPVAYAACDAFVLPTAELECFGIIALEALSAGRPVLATPVGAIPEIIRAVEPSWMSKSASTEEIADLISRFLHGELKQHTASELHDQVVQKYSYERVIGGFVDATVGRAAAR
jgi:glycosyltransferase involved in cell wall biosynthesis